MDWPTMRAATKVRMVENCILIEESKVGRLQVNLRNGCYEIVEIAVVVAVEAMGEIEVFIFESRHLRRPLFSCTTYSALRTLYLVKLSQTKTLILVYPFGSSLDTKC